jgi:hypothetical protein
MKKIKASIKKEFSLISILLLTISIWDLGYAQVPEWSVNSALYQYQASITAVVQVDFQPKNELENQIAFFKGDEIRGVAKPVRVSDKAYYFIQVYSNEVRDTLSVHFYDSASDNIILNELAYVFNDSNILGTIDEPQVYNFIVNYNFAPEWENLPERFQVETGQIVPVLSLSEYASDKENDALSFSVNGMNNLSASINASNELIVTYQEGFTGTEELTLAVFETGSPSQRTETSLEVSITPKDIPPTVTSTNIQVPIFIGESQKEINLDTFFESIDGNALEYSAFPIFATEQTEKPNWSVNPANFELTMNVTARVSLFDLPLSGTSTLAVFVGDELRGFADAQLIGNQQVYFLTVYANQNGEELRFKLWHDDSSTLLEAKNTLLFNALNPAGTLESPFKVSLSGVEVLIEDQNLTLLINPFLTENESISVRATEVGTENSFYVDATFTFIYISTEAPVLKKIYTGQQIEEGNTFNPVDLDTLLTNPEIQSYRFSIRPYTESDTLFIAEIDDTNLLQVSLKSNMLFGSSSYLLRVEANDNPIAADSTILVFERISTYVEPSPFALISPTNTSILNTIGFSFSWQSSELSEGLSAEYQLTIIRNSADTLHIENISDPTYTLNGSEGIQYSSNYEWYVTLFDGRTYLESTEHWFFSIGNDVSIEHETELKPIKTALLPNYPNPFNPTTTIRYQLQKASPVQIQVYDVTGKEIALLVQQTQAAGSYSLPFDARSLSSGMYFVRLVVADQQFVRKIMLIK